MTEQLGKLFGSVPKVKIMRLFMLNPEQSFSVSDISERSKVSKPNVRHELKILQGAKFISPKRTREETETKRGKKSRMVPGFILNPNFQYIAPLKALLIDADFMKKEDLIRRFRPVGKIKLFIASGVFLRESKSRVDFLLVGDNLKRNTLETIISKLEAEVGKELSYAVFDTKDFSYRLSMYDKLIREVLDAPHERIIEAPEFSTRLLQKS